MIDYFALLDIERRPTVGEDLLKNAYFRKTEALRSQKADAEALSSLNAAFKALANPATRVQHLLMLKFGDAGGGQIGSDLGELFGSVATVLQEVDQEFGSLSNESSALVRALAFQRMEGVRESLNRAISQLSVQESGLLSEIDRLDSNWLESSAESRQNLAQVALSLTFVQKWLGEIRERKIRLEELA
jgi:hypothetical protein